MLTKDLISAIATETGMTKKQTKEILATTGTLIPTSQVLLESLCEGKSVQLQGFGVLEAKEKAARMIVHPKTGERSMVPGKTQIVLRPSNNLKDELKNCDIQSSKTELQE